MKELLAMIIVITTVVLPFVLVAIDIVLFVKKKEKMCQNIDNFYKNTCFYIQIMVSL